MWKYEETRNFGFYPWPQFFFKGEEEVDNDIFDNEENENSWEDELHQENSDVEKTSG